LFIISNTNFNDEIHQEAVAKAIGQNPVPAMSQQQFASFVSAEIPRWREIVRSAHIEIHTLPAQQDRRCIDGAGEVIEVRPCADFDSNIRGSNPLAPAILNYLNLLRLPL